MTGLVAHMSEDWGVIEADFQRFYGLDLRRVLWVDRVGVRRLWDLIAGLPPESAFQHSLSSKPKPVADGDVRSGVREVLKRMSGVS